MHAKTNPTHQWLLYTIVSIIILAIGLYTFPLPFTSTAILIADISMTIILVIMIIALTLFLDNNIYEKTILATSLLLFILTIWTNF